MQAATDLQYGRKDLERSAESNNLCQYFGQVIHYFVLGQAFFFLHYTAAKTSLSLPAKRLSCLYVQWFVHVDALCKEGLLEKCVLASKFILYRRSMNSLEAFFN